MSTERWRRGKLVPIPPEWQGVVTRPQTQRKRASHYPRKMRKYIKSYYRHSRSSGKNSLHMRSAPTEAEWE